MSGFKIPLDFSQGNFYENNKLCDDRYDDNYDKKIKESINNFIKLIITSPNGSFKPDARFGFTLKSCHFITADSKDEIRGKKIIGKSDNINNYAKDLEKSIKLFEPRLKNIIVKTEFEKAKSKVSISISGMIIETKKNYSQFIEFYIWNNNENIRRV